MDELHEDDDDLQHCRRTRPSRRCSSVGSHAARCSEAVWRLRRRRPWWVPPAAGSRRWSTPDRLTPRIADVGPSWGSPASRPSTADEVTVPPGYTAKVLIAWGEPVSERARVQARREQHRSRAGAAVGHAQRRHRVLPVPRPREPSGPDRPEPRVHRRRPAVPRRQGRLERREDGQVPGGPRRRRHRGVQAPRPVAGAPALVLRSPHHGVDAHRHRRPRRRATPCSRRAPIRRAGECSARSTTARWASRRGAPTSPARRTSTATSATPRPTRSRRATASPRPARARCGTRPTAGSTPTSSRTSRTASAGSPRSTRGRRGARR